MGNRVRHVHWLWKQQHILYYSMIVIPCFTACPTFQGLIEPTWLRYELKAGHCSGLKFTQLDLEPDPTCQVNICSDKCGTICSISWTLSIFWVMIMALGQHWWDPKYPSSKHAHFSGCSRHISKGIVKARGAEKAKLPSSNDGCASWCHKSRCQKGSIESKTKQLFPMLNNQQMIAASSPTFSLQDERDWRHDGWARKPDQQYIQKEARFASFIAFGHNGKMPLPCPVQSVS